MKHIAGQLLNFSLLTLLLSLVACGGGGGGGGGGSAPTAAKITAENAQSLSVAALDAAERAAAEGGLGNILGGGVVEPNQTVTAISQTIAQLFKQHLTVSAAVIAGDCGGTINIPETSSGTIVFNDYCVTVPGYGEMIMNGSVSYSYSDPVITLTYNNFTVSYGGETYTINMSATVNINTGEVSWTSSFTGSDGTTLTYSEFDVSGDPSTGITVNYGRVTYGDAGFVEISTEQPIVFSGCTNGRPMSGSIVAEGSNGTMASITFNDCNSYTWCYDLNDGAAPTCNTGMW